MRKVYRNIGFIGIAFFAIVMLQLMMGSAVDVGRFSKFSLVSVDDDPQEYWMLIRLQSIILSVLWAGFATKTIWEEKLLDEEK